VPAFARLEVEQAPIARVQEAPESEVSEIGQVSEESDSNPCFPDTDSEFEDDIPISRRARTCDVGLFYRSSGICQASSTPDASSSSRSQWAHASDTPLAPHDFVVDNMHTSADPVPVVLSGTSVFDMSRSPCQPQGTPDVGQTVSTTDAMSAMHGSEPSDVDDALSMSLETDTDEMHHSVVTVIGLDLSLFSSQHLDPMSCSASSNAASSSSAVPQKARPKAAATAQNQDQSTITTLMLRNLPKMLIQQQLLDELNCTGFAGCYDFCYMPCDFEARENQGIAFVNFTSSFRAAELRRAWHRRRCFGADMAAISVVPAAVQGLEANLRAFGARLKRVRNPRFRPFVFGVPQIGSSTKTVAAAVSAAPAHAQAEQMIHARRDRRQYGQGQGGNRKPVGHVAPRAPK